MTEARPIALTAPALERLAAFVANAPLEPDTATLRTLRNGVVDCLGCILVGSGTSVAQNAQAGVKALGSGGRWPVYGTDLRVGRPQAALLNAVAGHALDFDDWEAPGNTHPTVVILPALLAAAEDTTSGTDLIAPYLAGFEVIVRLGEAMNFEHYDGGWHTTATLGGLGATAAVARLLQLDAAKAAHALSLAASRAAGYTCQFGSNAKPLQAGFAAQAGVECAFLAQAGVTGQAHVLDHPKGMAALTRGADPARMEAALERLGKPLALAEHGLILKPWPSCGYTHRIMTCALELAPGLGSPNQIEQIDLHLPDFHYAILPFDTPSHRSEALFSLPFVCAMGLARQSLTLADVARPTWDDPDIAALIAKTRVHPFRPKRPDQNYAPEDPDRLEITLTDGLKLTASCTYPIGAPQHPMTEAQLRAKFTANAGPVSQDWVDALFDWPCAPSILSLLSAKGDRP
ncbi:MAG: MmgE/PrpD family protein [Ruegeria sp.]